MKTLIFLAAALGVLWLGDRIFYKGSYSQSMWQSANIQAQKANIEIKKWIR